MDLTEKILHLDTDASKALKKAEASILRQKQEVATYSEQLKTKQIQSFENQKREESAELTKKLETARQNTIITLGKRMKVFEEEVTVDKVVEHLIAVVRGRVCP